MSNYLNYSRVEVAENLYVMNDGLIRAQRVYGCFSFYFKLNRIEEVQMF